MRLTTKARVQLTIEVESDSYWGPDSTAQQIFDQAASGALGRLRNSLEGYIVIGEPVVTMVTSVEDR